ncbi:FGGY-family carbohydrate kinase [Flavihumibacter sp. ZG627]|uniref:FGGY-family carbohydrate kinase n=1 Tax=Flavihumibacter sp. ZG627 TaxID=1463156 RepID=UPI000693A209|nr:FGGY family carbohydrate kinase [Flavihumibacter sp. ZG627]
MEAKEVIAVLDIGKTNKKLILFDRDYQLVWEREEQLKETTDADGFPCEDIKALSGWMLSSLQSILDNPGYNLRAINCAAYGASFVLLDESGQVIAPLYNYLKPYPEELLQQFYDIYGGRSELCRATASPPLGSLNSGLQLYRLKMEDPELFSRLHYALHLPQYLAYLLTGHAFSDITSIGCHTHLWNFDKSDYHNWVYREGIDKKLAPIHQSSGIAGYYQAKIPVGVGLHDSSAALVPYLQTLQEPFVLLSTGTWCISLNPFNDKPLTDAELQKDCLCYLSYEGRQVKASRLFLGYEHEQEVKKLAAQFDKPFDHYKHLRFDPAPDGGYEKAYHRLVGDMVHKQVESTSLVIQEGNVNRIFVDGGFSGNDVYMKMLAAAFSAYELRTAEVAQASALGAAMTMHDHWNTTR